MAITRFTLLALLWSLCVLIAADDLDIVPMPDNYVSDHQVAFSYADAAGNSAVFPVTPLADMVNPGQVTVEAFIKLDDHLTIAQVAVLSLPMPGPQQMMATLTNNTIAFLECNNTQAPGTQGNIVVAAFDDAQLESAFAVLLWSLSSPGCNLTGSYGSPIANVFTITSTDHATELLAAQQASKAPIIGTFGNSQSLVYSDYAALTNNSAPLNGNFGGYAQLASSAASDSTKIAMIVLYTITAVISALFLLIIFLGAHRAHRHPERYGPRRASDPGTFGIVVPRSRAAGLARAMLDSLPVVKFGGSTPAKDPHIGLDAANKPQAVLTVLPLAEVPSEQARTGVIETEPVSPVSASDAPTPSSPTSSSAHIADATHDHHDTSPEACSICTEDFRPGEDMRILPCKHAFHPTCIDPWLLRRSTTCPLCRTNLLRPPRPVWFAPNPSTHSPAPPPPPPLPRVTDGVSVYPPPDEFRDDIPDSRWTWTQIAELERQSRRALTPRERFMERLQRWGVVSRTMPGRPPRETDVPDPRLPEGADQYPDLETERRRRQSGGWGAETEGRAELE